MISVVIPTFNAAPTVERAIRSVFAQATTEEVELIVVDDVSRDETVRIVLGLPFGGIRLLTQEENQGAGGARQRGIMEARGRYLAFLDADDYWESGFLQQTTAFLDEHSEVIAVSVMQRNSGIGARSLIAEAVMRGEIRSALVVEDFFSFWAQYDHLCPGSVMIRTATAQLAGGMRCDLRVTEDLEFWGLLGTYGKWGFIPEVLFVADGRSGVSKNGWVEKNMPRWRGSPTVEDWSRRIVGRLDPAESKKFAAIQGIVGRHLSLGMILSGRDRLARDTVRKYGDFFPRDRMCSLLRSAATCWTTWKLFCWMLRRREYNRRI